MNDIVGWKIWYSNGSTFDSTQGAWLDAPNTGVAVVVVYFNRYDNQGRYYRQIEFDGEYYYLEGNTLHRSTTLESIKAKSEKTSKSLLTLAGTYVKQQELVKDSVLQGLKDSAYADYGQGWLFPLNLPDIKRQGVIIDPAKAKEG